MQGNIACQTSDDVGERSEEREQVAKSAVGNDGAVRMADEFPVLYLRREGLATRAEEHSACN